MLYVTSNTSQFLKCTTGVELDCTRPCNGTCPLLQSLCESGPAAGMTCRHWCSPPQPARVCPTCAYRPSAPPLSFAPDTCIALSAKGFWVQLPEMVFGSIDNIMLAAGWKHPGKMPSRWNTLQHVLYQTRFWVQLVASSDDTLTHKLVLPLLFVLGLLSQERLQYHNSFGAQLDRSVASSTAVPCWVIKSPVEGKGQGCPASQTATSASQQLLLSAHYRNN